MKKLLTLLLLLILSFIFVIFHDKGNKLLKPYLSNYLETKLEQNISLEITHLKVDLNHLQFEALLNDLTKVEAEGGFSLITQVLDLNYKLSSDGFKNEQISFENKVDINGTLTGSLSDMYIQGEGETLKSHINYALNIKDDAIKNIKVKINKADIASLLQLAKQPAYAQGKVDVDINIPTFKETSTKGDAKITLHRTLLNEEIFKKVLKVDLPSETTLTANFTSEIGSEIIQLEGDVKSNLAWLKLANTSYNLNNKELLSNYRFFAPQLSKLIFLTKQKLKGQLQVNGTLKLKENKLFLKGETKELDGETSFEYTGSTFNANMKDINIAKLLYMTNQKPYATGQLLAHLKLDDLKKLRGLFHIETKEAKSINQTFKDAFDLDLGEAVPFSFKSKGEIASHLANIETSLYSDIFQYRSSDMLYDLTTKKLTSTYLLDLPDLSRLNALSNKPLKGEVTIKGEINYDKIVNITGETKSLGGNIDFELKEKIVSAKIDTVPVERLMSLLSYPLVFQGTLLGDFYYDLASRQGTLDSTLNQAQLLSNTLTELIKQVKGVDLSKERYNKTHFKAVLNKELTEIDFQAKSKRALFSIPAGQINKTKNTIDAQYKVAIDNKDIQGQIKGDIDKPKVTIDSSNFIQEKVLEVIKETVNSDTLKDLGIGKEETSAIKNLLGDLFK